MNASTAEVVKFATKDGKKERRSMRKNSNKGESPKAKDLLLRSGKNIASNTGSMVHDIFFTFVYMASMLILAYMMIYLAVATVGLLTSYFGATSLTTTTDLMVMITTIIMTSGIMLIFTYKIINYLFKALKKRLKFFGRKSDDSDK